MDLVVGRALGAVHRRGQALNECPVGRMLHGVPFSVKDSLMITPALAYLRRHHIGLLALFVALSGTAYAATLPRNSVGTAQLKANAVTTQKVKQGSLVLGDIKASQRDDLEGARGPQGPAGPAGPAGAAGAAGATNVTVRTGGATTRDAAADCLPGEKAVGGGGFTSTADAFIYDSAPTQESGTPTSWSVSAETATAGGDATVQAYVICASP
jgi:hypothetical protein